MINRTSSAGEPVRPWCCGWAPYLVEREQGKSVLVVGAHCRVVGVGGTEVALLDTGAQWSLIGGDLAELTKPVAEDLGYTLSMSTRFGTYQGRFYRVDVELIAETGNNLRVSATAMLMPDWPGPALVLGYRGLLERVRFGFDPGTSVDGQWLCFGQVGPPS